MYNVFYCLYIECEINLSIYLGVNDDELFVCELGSMQKRHIFVK